MLLVVALSCLAASAAIYGRELRGAVPDEASGRTVAVTTHNGRTVYATPFEKSARSALYVIMFVSLCGAAAIHASRRPSASNAGPEDSD